MANVYDETIKSAISVHFPELLKDHGPDGWKWVKAQVWQESDFEPRALSHCGAKGLMQLMPDLCAGIDPYDPTQNINRGVSYLAEQYRHFPEIPDIHDKLSFAFASYNGGRGYANKALSLARAAGGVWQTWLTASPYLKSPGCMVNGRHPDYKQILGYVDSITHKVGML